MSRSVVAHVTALIVLCTTGAAAQTPLSTELVADGLSNPLWAGAPLGDRQRIFVAEQNSGRIRIIREGVLLAAPFLDLSGRIKSGFAEGLLGVAFHPRYASNGQFFVSYSAAGSGDTVVERYQVSAGNPDLADPGSGLVILGPVSRSHPNHGAGCIEFGPDDHLYVTIGDGGGPSDTHCNAQNGQLLLGKLLRLDVDRGGIAPPDNPFVGNRNFDDRIWAFGLRNPWRFSFDPENGDLYLTDVGTNMEEEIDWVAGSAGGGQNFGWKVMEGRVCFDSSGCDLSPVCGASQLVEPVLTYGHAAGDCSVIGGYVYRGCAIPDLRGTYFFADWCSSRISSLVMQGGVATAVTDRSAELKPPGGLDFKNITSFGRDGCGELLICDHRDGELFRIVPAAPAPGIDLGYSLAGSNGVAPELTVCGLLDSGNRAELTLEDARPDAVAILFASQAPGGRSVRGGTLVPGLGSTHLATPFPVDGQGRIELEVPGGGGLGEVYIQFIVDDPGGPAGAAFSNALRLTIQP